MNPQDIALIVTSGISVAAIFGWLYRKDTKLEQLQATAVDLSADLSELGLEKLASFAKAVAIKDISGAVAQLRMLARELSKDGGGLALLSESFFKQLPNRLKDEGDLVKIRKAVADYDLSNPKPTPPATVKADA